MAKDVITDPKQAILLVLQRLEEQMAKNQRHHAKVISGLKDEHGSTVYISGIEEGADNVYELTFETIRACRKAALES